MQPERFESQENRRETAKFPKGELPADAAIEEIVSPERAREVAEVVSRGIEQSYDGLRTEYEEPSPDRKGKELLFHNRAHTEGVVKRTEQILSAAFADVPGPGTTRLIELGKLIAAYHDRKNESEIVTLEDKDNRRADGSFFTKKVRRRATDPALRDALRLKNARAEAEGTEPLTETEAENLAGLEKLGLLGTNELDSAEELQKFLKEQRGADGKPLFSENDKAVVYEALAATVPGWDVKNGTVQQINLNESSSKLARAVALADLGEAGINPQAFIEAGDALVLEDNPDIAEVLREPKKYDDETKQYVAKRLIAWTESQAAFAVGRKNRLKDELKGFEPNEAARVEQLFQQFGEDEVELSKVPEETVDADGNKKIEIKRKPPYVLKEGVTPTGSAGRAAELTRNRKGLSFDQLRQQVLANAEAHKKSFSGAAAGT